MAANKTAGTTEWNCYIILSAALLLVIICIKSLLSDWNNKLDERLREEPPETCCESHITCCKQCFTCKCSPCWISYLMCNYLCWTCQCSGIKTISQADINDAKHLHGINVINVECVRDVSKSGNDINQNSEAFGQYDIKPSIHPMIGSNKTDPVSRPQSYIMGYGALHVGQMSSPDNQSKRHGSTSSSTALEETNAQKTDGWDNPSFLESKLLNVQQSLQLPIASVVSNLGLPDSIDDEHYPNSDSLKIKIKLPKNDQNHDTSYDAQGVVNESFQHSGSSLVISQQTAAAILDQQNILNLGVKAADLCPSSPYENLYISSDPRHHWTYKANESDANDNNLTLEAVNLETGLPQKKKIVSNMSFTSRSMPNLIDSDARIVTIQGQEA